jgi:hypothetical protein
VQRCLQASLRNLKVSACEDTCEEQRTEGITKCNAANATLYSAMYGPVLTKKALDSCKGQADYQRAKCKEVCRRACKPTETPAGTGAADTKPPAAPTDSADSKPFGAPEEAGSADPEHPGETVSDSESHDTDTGNKHGEAADTGNP